MMVFQIWMGMRIEMGTHTYKQKWMKGKRNCQTNRHKTIRHCNTQTRDDDEDRDSDIIILTSALEPNDPESPPLLLLLCLCLCLILSTESDRLFRGL